MNDVKPWRILYHNFEEAIEQVKLWKEPYQLAYSVTEIPEEPITRPTDEATK